MKEEDTRKPEHPEDPRQARQQAPVRLIKGSTWINPHNISKLEKQGNV